ncbi:MAG: FAD-dependent oxidoreductase [Pseudomonadota bacterium]
MPGEVTILGAGIVGICTALSLLERGVPVRIIDRAAPGQETSFGNAGVISSFSIVPHAYPGIWRDVPGLMVGKYRPLSVRARMWPRMIRWGAAFLRNGTEARLRAVSDAMEYLCGPSVDLYRHHLQGTGAEDVMTTSTYVQAFRDGSKASLGTLGSRVRLEKGADMEVVGADALHCLEPALSRDFKAAILIKGQARARNPGRISAVLADKARRLGAEFLAREVRALKRAEAGWQIECQGEVIRSETVVLSMGAWSGDLLRPLGYRLPLMTERGYHVQFADPGITVGNSVLDVEAACIASSMEQGLRFAGQAEFAPNDAPIDPKRQAHLTRLAKGAFPELNTASPTLWMGRRPSFPDSIPVLGALGEERGLFVNFGHSHHGLMMAPKSGEVLADIVTQTTPNRDLSAFSTDRF